MAMAGLQVLLCSRCRASINIQTQNKRQRTETKVFTCRHWQPSGDFFEATQVTSTPSPVDEAQEAEVPSQQDYSDVSYTAVKDEEQCGTAHVPDTTISGNGQQLRAQRCDSSRQLCFKQRRCDGSSP
mmetsp:Transcript_12861/g.23283  ORF Transcript_12861/g.23283 Transcript_12861/m.23283 type:complete len:127 (-) Transcript_12861:413-793(-)